MRVDDERITVSLPDACPAVRVDAAQIERVLVNLLENALGHSSPTDPVEIRAEQRGCEVVISVGRPRSRRPAWGAVRRSSSRSGAAGGGGTGLGLAIARGFAELNGGRLRSSPGSGTTFALSLPAVELPAKVSA